MYQIKFQYISFSGDHLIGILVRTSSMDLLSIGEVKFFIDGSVRVFINNCDMEFLKKDAKFLSDFKLKTNANSLLIARCLSKNLTKVLLDSFYSLKSKLENKQLAIFQLEL